MSAPTPRALAAAERQRDRALEKAAKLKTELDAHKRRARDAWALGGPDAWREHLSGKTSYLAVENSVRAWGARLGAGYVALAAERLVAVDVDREGMRLVATPAALRNARLRCERWSAAGPRKREAA